MSPRENTNAHAPRRTISTRIADYDWPLLDWGRYLVTTHVVRLFAGAVFRSTPIWVIHMRLNGAQSGAARV